MDTLWLVLTAFMVGAFFGCIITAWVDVMQERHLQQKSERRD